jgi:hypothetical protein
VRGPDRRQMSLHEGNTYAMLVKLADGATEEADWVVYEDVYVVEAILQDGDAHRNGQPHHTGHYQHEADLPQPTNAYRVGDYEREDGACGQHRQGIGKPLYLLALHSLRVAQSHQHGRRSAGAPKMGLR